MTLLKIAYAITLVITLPATIFCYFFEPKDINYTGGWYK